MRGETRFLTFRLPNIIGQCVELCTPTVELHGLLHMSHKGSRHLLRVVCTPSFTAVPVGL